jgi:hypothetical protein
MGWPEVVNNAVNMISAVTVLYLFFKFVVGKMFDL